MTRADHATISLDSPSITSDTLVGLHDGFLIRVAEADVSSVKASVPSPARTTALLIGIGVAAAYTTYLLVFKPEDPENICFAPGAAFGPCGLNAECCRTSIP